MKETMPQLPDVRAEFRARMEAAHATEAWAHFDGRIGVVLAGGGGRGAYEAGVLLAFQDARMPTHLITGASIGGINAASFAAHSNRFVGNAEPLLRTWMRLTPLAVGVDWTRYAWKLAGVVIASAGIGNFLETWLEMRGVHFTLGHPLYTWSLLTVIGFALLYAYDSIPYFGYVLRHQFNRARRRRDGFHLDPGKALRSIGANTVLWGSVGGLLISLGVLHFLKELMHPLVGATVAVGIAASITGRLFAPRFLDNLLHRFFRMPFRRGLFRNFDRTRLLRRAISEKKLRASPIRILFQATDVNSGPAVYFSNAAAEDLARDPGADPGFAAEVADPGDMILALVATSALPLAFEPIQFKGRLLADGGLVATQPIRPAVRLGADVLLLVSMEPMGPKRNPVKTFVDMGLRALNILVMQNFLADHKTLEGINAICEGAATSLGLRPEEVAVDLGIRRYRYVKSFTICPAQPLEATILEFGGPAASRAILQGYQDACEQVASFLEYSRTARFGGPKRLLRLEAVPENASQRFPISDRQ